MAAAKRPFDGAAIIFGGSEGIGLAVAQSLYANGIAVGLVSRNADRLAAARAVVTQYDPGGVCVTVCADVTDADSVTDACHRLIAELAEVSLVVSSAGYTLPGYVDALSADQYRDQWQHNCLGFLHVVQAMLPHFRARGGGHFVGTASLLGLMGMFGYSAYASSKFALVGLLHSLRAELAPEHIGVTALCPPAVDTPGFERENLIKPAEVLAAERRAGVQRPEQVAQALLRALPGNPALVLPGFSSRLIHLAWRLAPGLVARQLQRPATTP